MIQARAFGQSSSPPLYVRQLGIRDYRTTWRAMQAFTRQREASAVDELWLVEHPAVFTLGQAGKASHVLAAGDIPLIHVDRGGQVTFHGPGQQILYLLLDLRRRQLGVRDLVSRMEQAVVDTLADWDIAAHSRTDAPGVYVEAAKIASLGLRVSRGCCFHGLALNVDMELAPFRRINPCGHAGLAVTRMTDHAATAVDRSHVAQALIRHLGGHLGSPVHVADTAEPSCFECLSHPLQST
ncbi:MAG: lipoyl(octanoyl) transferase LipB [Kistimonas sp.]|nr:lipoyl(octanoyl) transferase LipB [Kistimonas sp.]